FRIARRLRVQDDKGDWAPTPLPVAVEADESLEQAKLLLAAETNEQDRMVARNTIGPQARLALYVRIQRLGRGALGPVGIKQKGEHPLSLLRQGGVDLQAAKLALGAGAGLDKGAIDDCLAAITSQQVEQGRARLRRRRNEQDLRALAREQRQPPA